MRNFYFILLFFVSFFSYSQKELNLNNNLTVNTLQADNVTRNIGFNFIGDNTLILKKFDVNSNTNYSYLTDRQNELLQRVSFTYRTSKNNLNTYSFLTYQFNSSLIRKKLFEQEYDKIDRSIDVSSPGSHTLQIYPEGEKTYVVS